jgi:hypothetical protein
VSPFFKWLVCPVLLEDSSRMDSNNTNEQLGKRYWEAPGWERPCAGSRWKGPPPG